MEREDEVGSSGYEDMKVEESKGNVLRSVSANGHSRRLYINKYLHTNGSSSCAKSRFNVAELS